MKINILPASKAALGFILGAGLIISAIPSCADAADSYNDTDSLAQFEVIHRTYDSDSDGLIHYHYEDEDGNTVEFSNTGADGRENSRSSKKAANIPASYDLRDYHAVTSIKDQGRTGACWSFAAIKSLESNIAMKNMQTSDNLDLSESHLIWYTYHPSTNTSDPLFGEGARDTLAFSDNTSAYDAGGNAILTSFILARWSGAATENAAPFHADTQTELINTANHMASQSETLRYRSDYLVTDAVCYDAASLDDIKEKIMENGAMDVSYYHDSDTSLYHKTAAGTAYYQTKLTGRNAISSANHSVTIVGWDDNYSKENFGTYKPLSDGAWLIANSYGSSFGEDGYFWISYEEPSLTEFYSFIAASPDTYDNNYQYDGYGWGNAIVNPQSDTTQAANIFTANNDYQQNLTAVGVYTVADNQPYTIRVYRSVTAGKPTSGRLAATISGIIDYQGYHTLPLGQTVSLNPGEKFSVVVSYEKTNDETGYIPLEGDSYYENPYRVTYNSNAGESFIHSSSTWVDVHNSYQKGIENNVCIKAFTKNGMAAGNISLSHSKLTLGIGETASLTASVQNIQDKTVTYTSSNSAVATVNSSGKITAKKAGSARITATLVSGKSVSATVSVRKAPSKITVTPANQKTIKKSKSFRIKVSLPKNSYSSHITYTSSKPSIVKVTASGKVTGVKKGKSVITVKTHNGKTAKITVTVH